MGFLHHANYFTYFEIGRTELLRTTGRNYRRMEAEGLFVVVVRAECHYQKPARYDDLLAIRTTVASIGPIKIVHDYEVFRGDERLATGRVTLAVVDREGRVRRVPEWMLEDDEH